MPTPTATHVTCPYCASPAQLVDAAIVYGRSGFGKLFLCADYPKCDAYVQADDVTGLPKGSLARSELRVLRKNAHALIDPLWRVQKVVDRQELYAAAAMVLGLKKFSIAEMREGQATAFVAGGTQLVKVIMITVKALREEALKEAAARGNTNLVPVLKYLFVESHAHPCKALVQSRYRGHAEVFKSAIEFGLAKRVKRRSDAKVFIALTSAGESCATSPTSCGWCRPSAI